MDGKKYFGHPVIAAIVAILCSILWGSAFPVLKISYLELGLQPDDIYGKILFAGMRFFVASILIFLFYTLLLKPSIPKQKRHDMHYKKIGLELLGLGLLQTTLQYFFFYNGLAHTSGMKGAILGSIGNFFVVLLAHFIYHNDRLSSRKILGLITGFTGIIIVNWGQSFGTSFSFMGEGFLILSGFVSALGTFLAKRLSGKLHPFMVTGWQMLLGSLVLLIFGTFGTQTSSFTFTPLATLLFFYSAFLSATAFSLWYTLLKYNKAGEITLYRFMIPVAGAVLSTLFIPEETFTIPILGGLLFVSAGIMIVNYSRKKSSKS